jgi:signal transduction histidine kinase
MHDARLAVATIQLLLSLHSETECEISATHHGELWAIGRELGHLARLLDDEPCAAEARTCDLSGIGQDVTKVHQRASGTTVLWRGQGAEVRLGPTAVWSVLDNLVANACHAAGPHGIVVVSTACDDRTVTVRVEDSGQGLVAGTPLPGLGLRTVTRILAASGGSFKLEAGPSGGTVAIATMPSVTQGARGRFDPSTAAADTGT